MPETIFQEVTLMSKYAGTEVKYQGQEYVIVRMGDILAIVD